MRDSEYIRKTITILDDEIDLTCKKQKDKLNKTQLNRLFIGVCLIIFPILLLVPYFGGSLAKSFLIIFIVFQLIALVLGLLLVLNKGQVK